MGVWLLLTIFCRASDLFVMALALAAAVPDKSDTWWSDDEKNTFLKFLLGNPSQINIAFLRTSHFSFSFSVVVSSSFRCITELSALASCSDASAAESDSRVVDSRVCKSASHVISLF